VADNTTLNAGAGGDTVATDDIAGVKHQLVKVEFGVADSATPVSTTNPLPVDQTNTTIADGGVLPAKGVQVGGTDGSVFQVLSTDNAGRLNANINGAVPVTDNAGSLTVDAPVAAPVFVRLSDGAAAISALPVTDNAGSLTVDNGGTFAVQADTELPAAAALADAAANPTAPAVGAFALLWNGATWDRLPGSAANGLTTNLKALNGTAIDTNSGVKSAGTQRVVIATDQVQLTNALKVDGSAVTQPVSGTVSITANSAVNVAQVAGTTTAVNAGTVSAGVQRVTLASDQTTLTNTIGNVGVVPVTSGGLSVFHLVSAATTNATNVKASAGQLYGWYIYNSNTLARKVAFHNSAGTPTAGASIFFAIVIPGSSAANVEYTTGIAFGTGIAITTVTDLTDAGTTAVAASDLIINLFYK
jgi:hypothetical protein